MKTNALKIVLFLIGLLPSSIQSSAQLYTTEIQKVRELVAVAQRVPGLEKEIQALDSVVARMATIISADSVIKRTKDQLILTTLQERDAYKGLYEAQLKLTKLETKEIKRWKRRTVFVAITGIGLLILTNQ